MVFFSFFQNLKKSPYSKKCVLIKRVPKSAEYIRASIGCARSMKHSLLPFFPLIFKEHTYSILNSSKNYVLNNNLRRAYRGGACSDFGKLFSHFFRIYIILFFYLDTPKSLYMMLLRKQNSLTNWLRALYLFKTDF